MWEAMDDDENIKLNPLRGLRQKFLTPSDLSDTDHLAMGHWQRAPLPGAALRTLLMRNNKVTYKHDYHCLPKVICLKLDQPNYLLHPCRAKRNPCTSLWQACTYYYQVIWEWQVLLRMRILPGIILVVFLPHELWQVYSNSWKPYSVVNVCFCK